MTKTLRDEFAMAALACAEDVWDRRGEIAAAVETAYKIADAMLAARGPERENLANGVCDRCRKKSVALRYVDSPVGQVMVCADCFVNKNWGLKT